MIGPIKHGPALLVALGLAAAVAAPAAATNERALSLLAEGTAYAQSRDYPLAESRLQAALRADPQLAAAYRWLGRIYREQVLREQAVSALAHAVLLEPSDADSRAAIADLLNGPPSLWLDREALPALPLQFADSQVRLTDPRLAASAPIIRRTLSSAAPLAREEDIPGERGRCDLALAGYVLDGERWMLRFRLHYPSSRLSAFGADYGALAADSLNLLLHTRVVAEAYLGRARREVPVADAWLCEQGAPGGEAWSNNLLITGLHEKRPAGEWARQLTHEFGHLALPGVDHYQEPEAWANGALGERLFTKWLLANPDNGVRLLGDLIPADFSRARIAPLIRRFLAEGPASPLARGASAQAMDWYVGLALYVEAALGPGALSDAMAAAQRSTRAETFLRAVGQVMAQRAGRGLALDASAGDGADLWVYLPGGRWRAGDREVAGGWQRIAGPWEPGAVLTVRPAAEVKSQ